MRRRRAGGARGKASGYRAGWALGAVGVLVAVILGVPAPALADTASDSVTTHVQAAARVATAQGYRTAVAVLDLRTGAYTGAGDDTGGFAGESVVKVLIATELLLRGEMTGSTQATAYRMITQSDDAAADALYAMAGGDDVVDLVADHYGISDLGSPPSEAGWWGNTELTAKGLVELYAAVAQDPAVGPWLQAAMANATEYGSDGTYQFFGLPSATTGAQVKQGWGDDGDDSPNAVVNSTGYVEDGRYAVAILTDGRPSTYGATIAAVVTAEAEALLPGGRIEDPADDDPVVTGLSVSASGGTVHVTGSAADPDEPDGELAVQVREGDELVATATTGGDGRFAVDFSAPGGSHTYAVTVPNVGAGIADTTVTAAALTVDGGSTAAPTSVAAGRGTTTVPGTAPALAAGSGCLVAGVLLAAVLRRRRRPCPPAPGLARPARTERAPGRLRE